MKKIIFMIGVFVLFFADVKIVKASSAPLLNVSFQGDFSGNTYLGGQGDIINGTLTRSGSNEKWEKGKITISGNTGGMTFTPNISIDNGSAVSNNLVLEAIVTREAVDMTYNTLFSIMGSIYYRYKDNSSSAAEFGLVTNDNPYRQINLEASPLSVVPQHVALVYTVQNGLATLDAYLNGCKIGSTGSSSQARIDGSGIGFGHDVHPQAGNRGWNGNLYSVSAASFTGIFNPSADFQILPKSVAPGSLIPVSNCDTPDQKMKKAANVIPSSSQKAWQDLELTAFVHFGINTFTGMEWGSGLEDPSLFNPTALDAWQWVRTLKEAGFKSIILTTKHLDGFALWPTRYSPHSVRNSPWKNGQGDIVAEVANAAREEGLKFGVYIGVIDLNQAKRQGGLFGNKSPAVWTNIPTLVEGDNRQPIQKFTYKLNDYNKFFMNQLYELLTQYGPINEVWIDYAGPQGLLEKESYNEIAWFDMIKRLTPEGMVVVGPSGRGVANEAGLARPTEWSVVPLTEEPEAVSVFDWLGFISKEHLGTSSTWTQDKRFFSWWPGESDVTIRPHWFYLQSEDNKIKSLSDLIDIYHTSVGRNTNLLLNIPPDKRGLFTGFDISRLNELSSWIKSTFSSNLSRSAHVTASDTRNNNPQYSPSNTIDGNPDTYWQMKETQNTGELILNFDNPITFNEIMLAENLQIGQRVESFEIDYWRDNQWRPINIVNPIPPWNPWSDDQFTLTTIGHKKLVRIWPTTTDRLRLRILSSRLAPAISELGLYLTGNQGGAFSCKVEGPSYIHLGDTANFRISTLGTVDKTQLKITSATSLNWQQAGTDCTTNECQRSYVFNQPGTYYVTCNTDHPSQGTCTGDPWYKNVSGRTCGPSSYYLVTVGNLYPTSPAVATPTTNNPQPTTNYCPRKSQGDAGGINGGPCDGKIDLFDYSLWLHSQCHPGQGQFCASVRADFDGNGSVDDKDLTIWINNSL